MQHFRPGLTPAELDEVERKYGLPLSSDVRALWGWHDGIERGINIGIGINQFQLTTAIERGASTIQIRREGDAEEIWGADHEPDSSTRWVTLVGGQTSTEIDVTDPTRDDSLVLIQDPTSSLDTYPKFTVTESVEGWILAVEIGFWYVENGRWRLRLENYPSTPDRWRM